MPFLWIALLPFSCPALELLSKFRDGPTGPLSGVQPTIQYLQGLGKDNIDLIFAHSKWVLEEDGEEGLRVSQAFATHSLVIVMSVLSIGCN